ncbi:type II toxin-antitoxin system prevent-host-death family antitoxin [Sphingobium sp. DEHP117]|uniref:type II toxin-antitoxin system Phd/YefM family antitoxin n=1 Tax=Sphingobium sp. DEHP117 TaxID=2993436 RepID=UPI0027D6B300|nr:type II toxin-antitoxin system prevent-host-death family antitoxin [Sphingobium sp. DEHP117]MDQ4422118.1 type II toxin-antitoxin system prevent-host-death family antitoxin [Sphingobium sp. DEHP117]
METVNIHEAKTHLSRLLERVANGTAVVIARAGKPIAKVVPFGAPVPTKMKRLGFLKGEMRVPDDFDRMGAGDIESMFEG